jgi:hypothetical protein
MRFAVMAAAQRHSELIAHLAAERRMLGKAQMMRIRGQAATDETRLFGDKSHMFAVANPAGLGMSKFTFIDPFAKRSSH